MMKMKMLLVVLAILCVFPASILGYGEPDVHGRPVYIERASHLLTNIVRLGAHQYKGIYMVNYNPSVSSILENYKVAVPVYYEPTLINSAYDHSLDMGSHNCFSHNDCNGTAWATRMTSYYHCSGTFGENIIAGYGTDPISNQNGWLCDETNGACAADNTDSAGHRNNIMGTGYRAMGVGYYYNATSTYRTYMTQDFGGAACAPAPTTPVHSGSHFVSSTTTFKFVATYYVSPAKAPSHAYVYVGGHRYNLDLEVGVSGQGSYQYTYTNFPTGECNSYYFEFGGNGTFRYPETGCLLSYDGKNCTMSYSDSCPENTSGSSIIAVQYIMLLLGLFMLF